MENLDHIAQVLHFLVPNVSWNQLRLLGRFVSAQETETKRSPHIEAENGDAYWGRKLLFPLDQDEWCLGYSPTGLWLLPSGKLT